MNDFTNFSKELAFGKSGLDPAQTLGDGVLAIDTRMRIATTLTWIGGVFGFALTVWMGFLLLGDTGGADTATLVFYGAVLVGGLVMVATIKTWHFQMHSDSQTMKEILRLQDMVKG